MRPAARGAPPQLCRCQFEQLYQLQAGWESAPGRQGFAILPAALNENAAGISRFAALVQADLLDQHFRRNLPDGTGTLVNARIHQNVVRTRAGHSHIAGNSITKFL